MPTVKGQLARFNTIGESEIDLTKTLLKNEPLSGFLGGKMEGGRFVCLLEHDWQSMFRCNHAVAVNSATSGLLVACMAIGIKPGDEVIVSPFTMSATAAAPAFLGAKIVYADIDPVTFCLDPYEVGLKITKNTKAIIATNLFGHPAPLAGLKSMCGKDIYLIEDNAQAPFAKEFDTYAGTVGDIGVFSLNVHKHIQAGEGGVCVTNDLGLASAMRKARNHAELFGGTMIGLNLRMTELTAAIAIAQLFKGPKIIKGRVKIAESLTESVTKLDWLECPKVRSGCTHVYYLWAFLIDEVKLRMSRSHFISAMAAEGVPLHAGYVKPLHRITALRNTESLCPVADRLWERDLVFYENTCYSPTLEQVSQMGEAFHRVGDGKAA